MQEAGFKTLIVIARDKKRDILGGMLATYKEYPFLKSAVVPTISVMGGPLIYHFNDKKLLKAIVEFFDKKAKKVGALSSYIRSFLPLNQTLVRQLNYIIGHASLPCTFILDLSKSVEELWKGMDRKAGRWRIRKAEKSGVTIEEAKCVKDLMDYYRICLSTCKRLRIHPPSFQTFKALWKILSNGDNVKFFMAKHGSKPIAGRIVLRWLDKMWIWHGASLKEYWRLHANELLEWNLIKWGAENGVKMLDFLGIPCKENKKHPKYGLYLYKKQFGGKLVRHGEYVKDYSPLMSILLRRILRPIYIRYFHTHRY